jgi:hypothetical protein
MDGLTKSNELVFVLAATNLQIYSTYPDCQGISLVPPHYPNTSDNENCVQNKNPANCRRI